MTIYNRPATHTQNQFARIAEAYTLAGLEAPTYVLDLKAQVNNAPSVDQVAASLAAEALDVDDTQGFYEYALAQIQRAQAADALKHAFGRNIQAALDRKASTYRAKAAADLQPTFAKLAAKLNKAATKLPTTAPLDMASNIDAGTGDDYKQAREALAALGAYAAIYPQPTPQGEPTALLALLTILDLPTANIEQVNQSMGTSIVTRNEAQLEGTRTIRQLADDAKDDADKALVNVAAGRYKGVTLSLATPTEYNARRTNATTAYKRQSIREDGTRAA